MTWSMKKTVDNVYDITGSLCVFGSRSPSVGLCGTVGATSSATGDAATSAAAERSFSCLRRIKTFLRSTNRHYQLTNRVTYVADEAFFQIAYFSYPSHSAPRNE